MATTQNLPTAATFHIASRGGCMTAGLLSGWRVRALLMHALVIMET